MERLTHERVSGIKTGYWSSSKKQDLVDRLSEYEDTGLTPEQIRQIDDLYAEKCREVAELRERDTAKEPEEIRDAFGDGRLICPNCRNSVINYFNRSRPPRFCMICGQRLQWEE